MVKMGDFGSFLGCWGDKCFTAGVCMWCWGGKCFIAWLGVLVLGLCGREVRLAWLVGGENGVRLAQHEQDASTRPMRDVRDQLCTGTGGVRHVLGEFCTGSGAVRLVRASFVSPWHLPCSLLPGFRRPRALRTGPAGFGMASMLVIEGVCSIRSWLPACRRRVGSLMTPFPPFGGGEITV